MPVHQEHALTPQDRSIDFAGRRIDHTPRPSCMCPNSCLSSCLTREKNKGRVRMTKAPKLARTTGTRAVGAGSMHSATRNHGCASSEHPTMSAALTHKHVVHRFSISHSRLHSDLLCSSMTKAAHRSLDLGSSNLVCLIGSDGRLRTLAMRHDRKNKKHALRAVSNLDAIGDVGPATFHPALLLTATMLSFHHFRLPS